MNSFPRSRRAALKLSLALGVCAAWPAPDVRADDAATATALRALGGQVTEANGAVTKVSFRDCSKLGAAEFAAIGQLKSLKSLTLYGSCKGLTDETLAHFAGLTALEELGTDGIQVTDAGLKHLANLPNLRTASFFHIAFPDKGFTGAGFAAFKSLPKLERLTVAGTPFNAKGIAQGVPHLAHVSDAGGQRASAQAHRPAFADAWPAAAAIRRQAERLEH
jgi:hypothetical protein